MKKIYAAKTKTKLFIVLLFTSLLLLSFAEKSIAQNNKETFIICVFDNDSKKLTHMLLLEAVESDRGKKIVEKFTHHSFFTGIIKGAFKQENGEILPLPESMFLIFRDKTALLKNKKIPDLLKESNYPGTDIFLSVKEYIPGDMFVINFNLWKSKIKVEVLKNNMEETILKVL